MDLPEPRAGAAPAAEVESRAGAAPAAADESLGVDGVAGTNAPVTAPDALAAASDVRPHRSLWLLAIPNVLSRIGGSPQHPVGNGLLAEQFPPERRGFAISAHIAGGNVGTVVVAILGAPIIAIWGWRGASIAFGLPAIAIAIAILI